jgi:hypothetical protein
MNVCLQSEVEKEGIQFVRKSLEKATKVFSGQYCELKNFLTALELFYDAMPMSDHGENLFPMGKMSDVALVWSEGFTRAQQEIGWKVFKEH